MKQSGLSELKVLDIIENTNEIMKAKNFAMKYLEKNKRKNFNRRVKYRFR